MLIVVTSAELQSPSPAYSLHSLSCGRSLSAARSGVRYPPDLRSDQEGSATLEHPSVTRPICQLSPSLPCSPRAHCFSRPPPPSHPSFPLNYRRKKTANESQ